MKGFEGQVCGMRQGSKRCVVIPNACRRGTEAAGESTIIVMMEVRKVKKEEKPQGYQQQPQQGYAVCIHTPSQQMCHVHVGIV